MEVHQNIFPAPREVEARTGVAVEFEVGHTVGEFGGLFGILFDFGEWVVVFDARLEGATKPDLLADVNPIVLAEAAHLGNGRFACIFEIIFPDSADGEVVIIPKFAFVFSAISSNGGITGVDGAGLAVLIEKIGEADLD